MKGQIQCKLRKHHQIKKSAAKANKKKTELKKNSSEKATKVFWGRQQCERTLPEVTS